MMTFAEYLTIRLIIIKVSQTFRVGVVTVFEEVTSSVLIIKFDIYNTTISEKCFDAYLIFNLTYLCVLNTVFNRIFKNKNKYLLQYYSFESYFT